jgi:hypothetical protein
MTTTIKTLNVSEGSFDQVNTFTISKFKYNSRCSLEKDYKTEGDGIYWVLKHGACLQAQYSDADLAEKARLQSPEAILEDGEIVLIDGNQYKLRWIGDYSDCAIFDPVTA